MADQDIPAGDDSALIHAEFVRRFSVYDNLSQCADDRIKEMPEDKRKAYWLAAKELAENECLRLEIAEVKRRLYQELALKAEKPLEREGYRMTLMAIQSFEKRLRTLGSYYAVKPIETVADKL